MRDSLSRNQAMRQAIDNDHHHAPFGYEDERHITPPTRAQEPRRPLRLAP